MIAAILPYASLIVTLIILGHNIYSNYVIRGNELKHVNTKLDEILRRIERLEGWMFEERKD
jgi:hypothetical protein